MGILNTAFQRSLFVAVFFCTFLFQALAIADHAPDELIVKFEMGISDIEINQIVTSVATPVRIAAFKRRSANKASPMDQWRRVIFSPGANIVDIRAALLGNSKVIEVVFNEEVKQNTLPNDPLLTQQWPIAGDFSGVSIGADEAWNITTGNPDIVVAVIDSGINYNHPDLAANIWNNTREIAGNGIDDDGNGYIDDFYGYNFQLYIPDPMELGVSGHGTQMAGIIGAVGDNNIGITGVNWQVQLMALNNCEVILEVNQAAKNFCGQPAAIDAILYAVDNGADVINFSAVTSMTTLFSDAIGYAEAAGVLFVAAGGNLPSNCGPLNGQIPCAQPGVYECCVAYPADDPHNNVIAVGAASGGGKHLYSYFSETRMDIFAPGVNIYTTYSTWPYLYSSYLSGSGTSAAAAFVSGAVALIKSQHPQLTAAQIKQRIINSAAAYPGLERYSISRGLLSLNNALDTDDIVPNAVNDLAVTEFAAESLSLGWTSAGDDGGVGVARNHELRMSAAPITEINFDLATYVPAVTHPGSPGTPITHRIEGLTASTTYYFAVKTVDNVGNKSPISNVATVTTTALGRYGLVVFDDLENGAVNWTATGGMALSTQRTHSPSNAFFTHNTFGKLTYTVDLKDVINGRLFFNYYLDGLDADTGANLAKFRILAPPFFVPTIDPTINRFSPTDGEWKEIKDFVGTPGIDLSEYQDKVISIVFEYWQVDPGEGWFIDDFRILGHSPKVQPDHAPIANAGGPYTFSSSVPLVVLDGLQSFDPENAAITYSWDFGDGTTGSGKGPDHDFTGPWGFKVNLIVNDGVLDSVPHTTVVIPEGCSGADSDTDGIPDACDPIVDIDNTTPIAANDSGSTAVGTTVTFDVLYNDTDSDNDLLSVSAVTQGANGIVAINATSVSYTPNAAFEGADSFTYTISDGRGGFATATVTVSVAYNQLSPIFLESSAAALAALITSPLSIDGINLDKTSSQGFESTVAGRDLLRYLARCALPKGTSLSSTVGAVTYTFDGNFNFAPQWLQSSIEMDEVGQRWISSCVMAHMNTRRSIPISLRGLHPSLVVSPEEQAIFSVAEGAFYGNVFKPNPHYAWGQEQQTKYSCYAQTSAMLRALSPDASDRICTTSSANSNFALCGSIDRGKCFTTAPSVEGKPACEAIGANGEFSPCCEYVPNGDTICYTGLDTMANIAYQRVDEIITVFIRGNDTPVPAPVGDISPLAIQAYPALDAGGTPPPTGGGAIPDPIPDTEKSYSGTIEVVGGNYIVISGVTAWINDRSKIDLEKSPSGDLEVGLSVKYDALRNVDDSHTVIELAVK
jgi:subtilisin family serine protease